MLWPEKARNKCQRMSGGRIKWEKNCQHIETATVKISHISRYSRITMDGEFMEELLFFVVDLD